MMDDIERRAHSIEFINPDSVPHMTICVVVMSNGFVVSGISVSNSPGEFDIAKGRRVARDKAFGQIVRLDDYAARERMHSAA